MAGHVIKPLPKGLWTRLRTSQQLRSAGRLGWGGTSYQLGRLPRQAPSGESDLAAYNKTILRIAESGLGMIVADLAEDIREEDLGQSSSTEEVQWRPRSMPARQIGKGWNARAVYEDTGNNASNSIR